MCITAGVLEFEVHVYREASAICFVENQAAYKCLLALIQVFEFFGLQRTPAKGALCVF